MLTFRPQRAPTDAKEMPAFVDKLQIEVQKAALRSSDYTPLRYLDVAPDKPQDGIYLSAAGVLGVTRGAYRYDSSTALYTFLA